MSGLVVLLLLSGGPALIVYALMRVYGVEDGE